MPEDTQRTAVLKSVKRVVIKIGSNVLTDPTTVINFNAFARLVDEIAWIKEKGFLPIVVSSGAIAIGMRKLGLKQRPQSMPLKQAAAAVGQIGLMENYDRFFKERNLRVAQVLLTDLILKHRSWFLNARNTLFTLISLDVIPIINENDSVVVDEIKVGDNDKLATITTNLVEADLLIILTDTDGLFDKDPRANSDARLISTIEKITPKVEQLCSKTRSSVGTGGMATKLAAARDAARYGVPVIVANGQREGILQAIFRGDEVGTLFLPQESRLRSREHWIACTLKIKGKLIIDDGAQEALLHKGKSLLPVGIVKIEGTFNFGDCVGIFTQKRKEIGRGLTNYSSQELTKIKGVPSQQIEHILGYKHYDEVIHRDDMVLA
ncbi:MAG TPA: glutamate 5-kinase [Thermodesulfobacteriota bacterium]|nr:glutamate 5-kinase [Thermodesulfobacteriota bacterium]HNU72209.1 glutamate 5-kinase [Thermodesulfobacteriota bacterium]HOC38682.1 glutamate 5-kinase [Thermodesulfobacteriota bacterium]HQO79353.1 glutamate 5-kinase [Thermodesulfobacteriota bacterium]